MQFEIVTLLSPEEAARTLTEISRAKFGDGRSTAFGLARDVKHNLQADRSAGDWATIDQQFFSALQRNREFQLFAHPKRVLPPQFSRYEPGMQYGAHVDSAVMGGDHPMRVDLSMTLFLSPPDSYDGGALAIESSSGEEEIKLAPGEAVVYPSTTMHRVTPVTRGVRLAAVTWIQSAVRDERVRDILRDLALSIQHAETAQDGPAIRLLSKCYHNLLRYAVEP